MEKIPSEYTGVKGLVRSMYDGLAESAADSNNEYIKPFPGGYEYIKTVELCNGKTQTVSGSSNSINPLDIASGRIRAYLSIGDTVAINGLYGIISLGIPPDGNVGNNPYIYMNSGGIFGYYGDEEAPWFMVAQRDVSIGGTDYHGGDFFIGNKDYAYLWWEHDEARLTIAGNVLISGDIVSDNFEYDPVLGILNGYKLEREGGNAYFGGAVISGSSSVGGRLATTIGSAINSSGNFINDLINSNLSTASKQILGDFTFGSSGAIKMITDANNGLWLSPTGILGKKAGVTTFAIGIDGSPTFRGEITGGSININSSWHVDTSGNMWWGNSSTYAGATYRISSEGVANLSGLTVGTNVALGSAVDATGVASIINIDYLNAKGITAGSVAAENITGTYITGKTIQTAISGSRVEIRSAAPFSDQIVFYYGTDANPNGQIYASSGALRIHNPVAGGAIMLGTKDGLALTIFGTSLLSKTINPLGTTETLGSSTYPWYGLHLSSSTANFNGDFIPITNGTSSGGQILGSSNYKFYEVNSFFGNFDYLGKNLNANTYSITNLGSLVVNNGGSITLGGVSKTAWPSSSSGNWSDIYINTSKDMQGYNLTGLAQVIPHYSYTSYLGNSSYYWDYLYVNYIYGSFGSGNITMLNNLSMYNNTIQDIGSLKLRTGQTTNPSSSGEIRYYDGTGGGFRGRAGSWLGQFDMTAK